MGHLNYLFKRTRPTLAKYLYEIFFSTERSFFYSPGMGNTAVFTLRDNHAKHYSFLNLKIVSSSVNQNLHNLVRYVCLSTCTIQNNFHLQNTRYWKEEKVPTFRQISKVKSGWEPVGNSSLPEGFQEFFLVHPLNWHRIKWIGENCWKGDLWKDSTFVIPK